MTIEDLIAQLARYPKDAEVYMTEENYEPSGEFVYNCRNNSLRILP